MVKYINLRIIFVRKLNVENIQERLYKKYQERLMPVTQLKITLYYELYLGLISYSNSFSSHKIYIALLLRHKSSYWC